MQEVLITVDEAARILGLKPSTLRAWRLSRRIPIVRVGRRAIRIPMSAVERLISDGLIPARPSR